MVEVFLVILVFWIGIAVGVLIDRKSKKNDGLFGLEVDPESGTHVFIDVNMDECLKKDYIILKNKGIDHSKLNHAQ